VEDMTEILRKMEEEGPAEGEAEEEL